MHSCWICPCDQWSPGCIGGTSPLASFGCWSGSWTSWLRRADRCCSWWSSGSHTRQSSSLCCASRDSALNRGSRGGSRRSRRPGGELRATVLSFWAVSLEKLADQSTVLNGDALDNKKLGLDLVFRISLFHLTPLSMRARESKRERRVFGCRESKGKWKPRNWNVWGFLFLFFIFMDRAGLNLGILFLG